MARSTVNRTNPGTGAAHVVFTDATGGNREGVVLAQDAVDAPVTVAPIGPSYGVTALGASYAATTGTITTSTSTVTTGAIPLAGNITIGIAGTYAGVSVTFEASPDSGTNWYPVSASREDNGGVEGSAAFALPTNGLRIWTTAAPGFTNFRVRATAFTSGSAGVIILPGSYAFETMVSAVLNPLVASPAKANVAVSSSSATLRAANAARKGLVIANAPSSPTLYIDLTGGTATTTTAYSFPLPSGATYVMDPTTFTNGLVTGIWPAATGNGALVTEFT